MGARNYGQRTFSRGEEEKPGHAELPFPSMFFSGVRAFFRAPYIFQQGRCRWVFWVQPDQVFSSFCSKNVKRPGIIKSWGFNGLTCATDKRGVSVCRRSLLVSPVRC